MKKFNKKSIITALTVALAFALGGSSHVFAATSPTLIGSASYSALGGAAVTCTGSTTTTGDVGVSPGSSLTGFPSPCVAGPPGTTHINDASAIAAQADALSAFGVLDAAANADANCIGGIHTSGTDLTTLSPLVPGLYCSAGSFLLTGNLTLTGSSGVWVFKTVSTLITSPGSSVTGGDPCNIWWRIGSSATLDTTTAFRGTIIAQNGVTALNAGATLNGRVLALSAGTLTLNANVITGPVCAATTTTTTTTVVPTLPNTGLSPQHSSNNWWKVIAPAGIFASLSLLYLARKKRAI